jgi:hypothetical protein
MRKYLLSILITMFAMTTVPVVLTGCDKLGLGGDKDKDKSGDDDDDDDDDKDKKKDKKKKKKGGDDDDDDDDDDGKKKKKKSGGDLPKACEKYFDQWDECYKDMPAAAKGPLEDAKDKNREAWEKMLKDGIPESALEDACKQAVDAMKASCPK